jgi:hypothetical protein
MPVEFLAQDFEASRGFSVCHGKGEEKENHRMAEYTA